MLAYVKRRLLVAFLLGAMTLLVPASGAKEDTTQWTRMSECNVGLQVYALTLSHSTYAKMTPWDPAQESAPPLTPQQAAKLARKALDGMELAGNPKWPWILRLIALQEGHRGKNPKWLYLVSYVRRDPGPSTGPRDRMEFLVTMDGDVIKPWKRVAAEKKKAFWLPAHEITVEDSK